MSAFSLNPLVALSSGRTGRSFFASVVLFLALMSITVGYYWQLEFAEFANERSLASNIGFLLLINLNIIVVMVLVFLVAKNIITLVLDRRRNILGSRLRTRLVTAFVGLSLIPAVLLFFVARGILESVMQGWFSPQVASSVDGAMGVARHYYDVAETNVRRNAFFIARRLSELYSNLDSSSSKSKTTDFDSLINNYVSEKRIEYGLADLEIVDLYGQSILHSSSANLSASGTISKIEYPITNLTALKEASDGAIFVRPEHTFRGEILRAYAPVFAKNRTEREPLVVSAPYILVATFLVPPELGNVLSSVINSYDDYKELRTYRRPLASTYALTLLVVTLLVVFAAMWVGFYLARSLSVPIGLLAQGTAEVAHGNLDYQIPEVGDDELSILVRSFNMMTEDLKQTTGELVSRRRYMETLLENVAVGVISIDHEMRVTTFNLAAGAILGIEGAVKTLLKPIGMVLPKSLCDTIVDTFNVLSHNEEKTLGVNVTVEVNSKSKYLQLTVTKLIDDSGRHIGAVLLFDDVTELVSAQRMAAWREVARRIAHEIKNPLTPIQLSAQRMQRRFNVNRTKGNGECFAESDLQMIAESTETIVKQVENLRVLVNEFSRFARMPKSNPKPWNFNQIVLDAVSIYKEAHSGIRFSINLDEKLPVFDVDPEQINRALINLIDNGVSAVKSRLEKNVNIVGLISISTLYDSSLSMLTVTISDNGIGVSDCDKPKLFEPYFSTKRGGTGLGLAIVSTIVADHNGFIRVKDNKPSGASFIIELPVTSQHYELVSGVKLS